MSPHLYLDNKEYLTISSASSRSDLLGADEGQVVKVWLLANGFALVVVSAVAIGA
jgi:hypothetical protein